MLKLPLIAALLLAPLAAQAAPLRVMSINVCTDSVLLALLPPARITSLSWLARDPAFSSAWQRAAELPQNHGTAEEVLAQHPDLVIAGTYTTPATTALLARLHIPLLVVPPAETFDDIRSVTRQIATAVGAQNAGEALIARMDATLANLARTTPSPRFSVLAWNGGNTVPGPGTLFDSILTAAGGTNLAPSLHTTAPDLEDIAWSRPDILARGAGARSQPALRDAAITHPVLRDLPATRQITYPAALYACGTPDAADAAVALRATLLQTR